MFEHDYPYDPTYGYTQEDLVAIGLPPAPSDFDSFWQDTFSENASIPFTLKSTPADDAPEHVDVFDVTFNTLGNLSVGGWIVAPKDKTPTTGFVIGHGYGGRSAPDYNLLLPDAVAIFPCAPGFHQSASPDIPNTSKEHVIHNIAHRDTYIIRHSVASLWSATTALIELYPSVADKIYYIGGSFGGGLGALALPWDDRFKKGHLRVPTFGHHPLRLQCEGRGSGESVRIYHQTHPEVTDVLQYFDAATAASRITIPTHGAPALFDPNVPPPGQFAVCNVLSEMYILSAGHFAYPQQADETAKLQAKLAQWFA